MICFEVGDSEQTDLITKTRAFKPFRHPGSRRKAERIRGGVP